jgi:hypothetical protein
MTALGDARYGVQGGDAGSVVSTLLAASPPATVIGLHVNIGGPGRLDPAVRVGVDHCGGHPENALTRDEMLGVVTGWPDFAPVDVPTGIAVFPKAIIPAVRTWCDDGYHDIRHWTEMPRGGHVAALERPRRLIDDIRTFCRGLR